MTNLRVLLTMAFGLVALTQAVAQPLPNNSSSAVPTDPSVAPTNLPAAPADPCSAPEWPLFVRALEPWQSQHAVVRVVQRVSDVLGSQRVVWIRRSQPGGAMLVRMLEPPLAAGTGWLQMDGRLYRFDPHIGRLELLPSSFFDADWYGSDLTVRDVLGPLQPPKCSVLRNEEVPAEHGESRLRLTCYADTAAKTPIVEVILRAADGLPQQRRDFDGRGRTALLRHYGRPIAIGGRELPARIATLSHAGTLERTVLELVDLREGVPSAVDLFSPVALMEEDW